MIPIRTRIVMNARRLLPDMSVSVKHVNGRRLRVSLRRQLGLILRDSSRYEPRNTERLRSLIQPRMVVYDAGAQVGFYTTLFSEWVGPDGRVFAFEPDPRNLALLRENAAATATANVEVVDRALSDRSSAAGFLADTVTGATGCLESVIDHNSLAHQWSGLPPFRISVRTISIDDFVYEESHRAPDLIKIDVEGSDECILLGMKRLLSESPPVIFLEGARQGGESFSILKSHGYRTEVLVAAADGSPYVIVATPGRNTHAT